MATNDILQFCPSDIGSNLLSQSEYLATSIRVSGNKPGRANSRTNNMALRQASFIASQLAQFVSDKQGVDVLDDANTAKLLAQMNAAFTPLVPVFTKYTSGTGTHLLTYIFFIAFGNASEGAVYTNNTKNFTVKETVANGVRLLMTGNGTPEMFGTLTKSSGTGDSTLTFYSVRVPTFLKVKMVAGGGGGAGGSSGNAFDGGTGGTGGNSTFGTSLLVANGGVGGNNFNPSTGGIGGSASIGSASGAYFYGGDGGGGGAGTVASINYVGGHGAPSAFGGGGSGGVNSGSGSSSTAGDADTGAGGGGGASDSTTAQTGGGGGAGGCVDAIIFSPLPTYAYTVGTAGTAGTAGSNGGKPGGTGGNGIILIEEHYN